MIQITVANISNWQQQVLAGPWMLENRFDVNVSEGIVEDITVNPNGDVAIISEDFLNDRGQIHVYSRQGVCKRSVDITRSPWQITTNSDGSIYFVTNLTHCVQMYSADCKYIGEWESICPHASLHASGYLRGLAVDANDNVYVGNYWSKCVHKHKQNGSFISCIKVSISPFYLAVTSQDTIIVSSYTGHPQIVSNTGQVLHTIKYPTGDELLWRVINVHCYRDTIFITVIDHEIYCFNVSGEYLRKLPIHPFRPSCLAMIGDDRLVISESRRYCSIYSLQK